MSALVCVPLFVRDPDRALHDAGQAKRGGADLVEWRFDELPESVGLEAGTRVAQRVVAASPLPCIATCRPEWEGGACGAPDEQRAQMLRSLSGLDTPPRYIDAEFASLSRSPAFTALADELAASGDAGPSLLLSTHDFAARPADLTRRLVSMRAVPGCRVIKVAFRARSLRDNLELFDLVAESDRPAIALGMGPFGLMSRVLAGKFGALLTFASLHDESATAPGQPTLDDLLGLYRFRSVSRSTGVLGVVGWPVEHSMSPLVHNAALARCGIDAVFLPLPVAAPEDASAPGGDESFKATMLELLGAPGLNFAGASVTIPHKERLVRLARAQGWGIDATSARAGAANTLVVGHDGTHILNTDSSAACESLRDALGDLAGKRVAVVGAGGVARAIVAALADDGAHITVLNRSPERARGLLDDLGLDSIAARAAQDMPGEVFDAIVNATPVGMTSGPAPSDSPVDVASLVGRPVVFDTVYNPVRTPMLARAQARGLTTIDGVSMFVRQAAAQFRAWTGREMDLQLSGEIVRTTLTES